MKSRHLARQIAFQFLFKKDQDSTSQTEQATEAEIESHFEHFKVDSELKSFARELILGTLKSIREIDALLQTTIQKWKVSRLSAVDRNILRMAAFEVKNYPGTPKNVILNEAIELAKEFGDQDSYGFINGILDAIK